MRQQALRVILFSGVFLQLLTGCGSPGPVKIVNPYKEIKEASNVIGGTMDGLAGKHPPLESIALASPLKEIRADDGSFTLTTTPTADIPYYSNEKGPIQTRYLSDGDWHSRHIDRSAAVRLTLDGYAEPIYGRLVIFPPANIPADRQQPERFNARITVTPEALEQMEKKGVGFSCAVYHQYMQDWCDWVVWISKTPLPE